MHGAGGKLKTVWKSSAAALIDVDPKMAEIIKDVGTKIPKVPIQTDPFIALVCAILHQQVSASQGTKRIEKLVEINNGDFPRPAEFASLGIETLRSIGITGGQARALLSIARSVTMGDVDLNGLRELSDAEVMEELGKLPHVGDWTSRMILLFHLERPDVVLYGDVGLRKAFMKHFDLEEEPDASEIERLSLRWKGHRSAACWYLWNKYGGFTPGLG